MPCDEFLFQIADWSHCAMNAWFVRTQAAAERALVEAQFQAERRSQHMEAQLQAAARTERWKQEREALAAQYRRQRDVELRFFPASCFSGAVPGHAFKMGEFGLGYYPDGHI